MDRNGANPTPSSLDEVLSGLGALINKQQKVVDGLEATLEVERAELRKLRNVQRAANPTPRKPKVNTGNRMGDEELEIIVERIRAVDSAEIEDQPGAFTSRMFTRDLGMSKSMAERVLNRLRTDERIRLVGERKMPGSPRPMRVYALNEDV